MRLGFVGSGLFLGVLLSAWSGAGGAVSAEAGLSVEQAIREALERNGDLEAARQRVSRARADREAARSAFFPNLSMDLTYTRAEAPSVYLFKTIDSRQLAPGTDFNDPGEIGNAEAGLMLRQTLWDGGRRRLSSERAGSGLAASRQAQDSVANDLIGSVIQSYYEVLAAGEFVTVAERSLATVDSQLGEVRVRHEHGGALRADVLAIDVRRAQAHQRLIAARNRQELARAALRRLLDCPPDAPLSLSGQDWNPIPLPTVLSECLQLAFDHRPEFAALDHRRRAAASSLRLAGRDYLPKLDLNARYWHDDTALSYSANRDNWAVAATLSWDLADGGRRRAQSRNARAALAELDADRRSLQRAIELQVQEAFLNLQEARSRRQVALANVQRAEEALELVRELFEGGSATATRYLQAEQDRTEALFSDIRSRYDIKQAGAALGHALGMCLNCLENTQQEGGP